MRLLIGLCLIPFWVFAAAKPPAFAVATAHPLATDAGIQILQQGGNAFDAAVTVSAVLAVVEPQGSGIGGGGFWLLHQADNHRQVMIDGREKAPLKAHKALYLDAAGEVIPKASKNGPLAAGIPGMPAALVHLAEHYGALPLASTLQPAIELAKNGFPLDKKLHASIQARAKALQTSPAAKTVFMPNGDVPKVGTLIKQPDLANTLMAIAQQGHAGFYQGRVAKALVSSVQSAGGIWQLKDLAQYRVLERQPIRGVYQGHEIISAAPPSSGGVVLVQMLNMLTALANTDTHSRIEVMRRAYRDRAEFLGDPDFVVMPLAKLLSTAYAQQRIGDVQSDQASKRQPYVTEPGKGEDTTHFSILDAKGNAVAATLSINYRMGSGFMAAGTGVLLNNEMDDFAIKPGHPNLYGLVGSEANAIAPGKRMLSSMSPTFVLSEDGLAILGTPGGSRIITMVLHAVLAYVEGKPVETMVSLPRYHHQYLPDEVQTEPEVFSPAQRQALAQKGHTLKSIGRHYGNMQAIVWDKRKQRVTAASDPRGIGRAKVVMTEPAENL